MGSVERHAGKRTVSWIARWRAPDGRQQKKAFRRRVDAERFLATTTADALRGNYVDPNDPTTLREFAETWREAQIHRPTTRAHVETHLRRHVYPYFGDRRLSTIRHGEIQAWVGKLARNLSPPPFRSSTASSPRSSKPPSATISSAAPPAKAPSSPSGCQPRSLR